MICPADNPVYCRNVLTCESSWYFQRDEPRTPCSRQILPQNFAPLFIRHSHGWMYSFCSKRQVNLKCRQNATWITSTWSLQGNGIFYNASACHVRVRTHKQSRVESSPIQSSQTLESRFVHTDRVESNQVGASSSGFQQSLNSEKSKNSEEIEYFILQAPCVLLYRTGVSLLSRERFLYI